MPPALVLRISIRELCSERCPEMISPRSSYPGGSIALVISGQAIIDEIYCHVSDQEVYHYLNLHGDNQAFSDDPNMKGSR